MAVRVRFTVTCHEPPSVARLTSAAAAPTGARVPGDVVVDHSRDRKPGIGSAALDDHEPGFGWPLSAAGEIKQRGHDPTLRRGLLPRAGLAVIRSRAGRICNT